MSNTLTNVNGVLTTQVIEALKLGLSPMRVFSLSVGSDPTEKNATINVPVITALSADTNATNYESGNTSIVSAQVSLGTNISKAWHLTAVESSKSEIVASMWSAMAVEATYAVAYAAQLAAFELLTTASFTNEETLAASAFDFAALLSIRKTVLGTLKWRDDQPKAAIMAYDYSANLFADPAVADKSASGMDIAASGRTGRAAGIDLYENGLFASTTTPAAEYLQVAVIRPDALALAIRPPVKLESGAWVANEILTEPETGVSLNYREWVTPGSNTHWGCVEILFGGVKVNGNSCYRVVSA